MSNKKGRPGFVLEVDRSTPPTLFMHGEGFRLERLPTGSRVVYPAEAVPLLDDPDGAIRHALLHPVDSDPLPALLHPGMKLTIAFDDISLPLPPMRRPDVRQRVIEAVLDLAADAGVDDVHLIAALALHRRMTEAELRHALGDRVYDAFAPRGALYNHDAEDPDNLAFLGETEQGEEVEINKRAAESDLLVYVNINLVSMDGGHKSTATGLASYRSLRHHHNVKTMRHSTSFMDQHRSELHSSNWRMGEVIRKAGVKIFQIETTLNNDTFPKPFDFLQKREWEWTARDRATFVASSKALDRTPYKAKLGIFQSIKAPHNLTGVNAGEIEAVHKLTTAKVYEQQLVQVEGQTDVLTMGLPYICPYNVNSVMNPILVACLGLGYFFNLYRGKPLVREGGVLIMSHPTPWAFHPVHHPSYIDFFEQVLADTTDPIEIEKTYERSFAEDEWYRHLYRTSYAYHGVHPFYMWYWCAHALQHLGGVIIVGGDTKAVRRLGFKPASTLRDALEMAEDVVGRDPSITHLHTPPILLAGGDVKRGFPWAAPTVPRGIEPMPKPAKLGADYETAWARKQPAARYARFFVLEGPLRAAVKAVADPLRTGMDRLDELEGPAIFAANHHSHLDAPLMLTSVPEPWRHRLVVGAAADYFFRNRATSAVSALALGAFPIERTKVSRRSADQAADLIREGWSLVIFPEGGRSPDGWGQGHRGGAAYLALKTGAPVVPVHIQGTGRIFGRGDKRPKPGSSKVTFGAPLRPVEGENSTRFAARIETAVAALADEASSDWWSARRRAAAGTTPGLTGPQVESWRRAWALTDRVRTPRRTSRAWPATSGRR